MSTRKEVLKMKKLVNKKAYRKAKKEKELEMCKKSSEYHFGSFVNGKWEVLPF